MGTSDQATTPANDPQVTLEEILDTQALAAARLLGPSEPGRLIGAVVVADADAPAEPDALILAPGAPPDPLPDGCAAVICRTPPLATPHVPVAVLPPGAPWGAVVAAVAGRFETAGSQSSAGAARAAFRDPLLSGSGFAGLAAAGREALRAPVALLDEYLDVLGSSGLDAEGERRLQEAVNRARGHSPASIIGPFLEAELSDLVRVPLGSAKDGAGVVVLFSPAPPTASQRAGLGELVEAALMEQARQRVRTETESQLRGDLLEELSAGEAVGRESVVRRARHLGADLAPGGVALVGVLFDPHDEGRVITDERLVRRFMRQARGAIDLHWPHALVDWWHDGLASVLAPSAPGPEPGEEAAVTERAVTLAERLLAATRETVPGTALTVGLSRYTREPERLGIALDEARLALSIGARLGRVGELITFEETGTYKLLFQLFADRPGELEDFYESTLAPLVAYDDSSQTELVQTLSTYLGNDCNLAATAGALYTHRHTVRYRLDRIADLCGLDVGRTDDREKLSLGLKTMRLLGIKPPSASEPDKDGGSRRQRAQAGRTSKP